MLAGRTGVSIDEFDNQLDDPNQYDNPQDPASLSVVEHLRALSVTGKLSLVYVVALLIYLLWKCDWVRGWTCGSLGSWRLVLVRGERVPR